MNRTKPPFMNFAVDHMTLCLQPQLYTVMYATFQILFGLTPEELLYEKRRKHKSGKEVSMTFANRIGRWESKPGNELDTIIAVVQPSEPDDEPSHVREMLDGHDLASHWQHIALRTPDLIGFHKFALERGIQFVTPILRDEHDNLIQIFSGELFYPGSRASGLFFEFLQREPSDGELAEIQKANKQTWFRDETFLGLYDEKEREYQSGKVRPLLSESLFMEMSEKIGKRQVWELDQKALVELEAIMLKHGKKS